MTDALTTAFMLLSSEEIAALCEGSPGLEAWVLPAAGGGEPGEVELLHFGGLHAASDDSATRPTGRALRARRRAALHSAGCPTG